MNILQINNVCGQAALVRRHDVNNTHEVVAMARGDPYSICLPPSPDHSRLTSKWAYFRHVWRGIRRSDVIHYHSPWSSKRWYKWVCRLGKLDNFVFHYHGTDMRMTPPAVRRRLEERVGAVVVSTPDLLQQECAVQARYIPTVIDVALFAPRTVPKNGAGLCILKGTQDAAQTLRILADYGHGDITWDFVCRSGYTAPSGPVRVTPHECSHADMPDYLAKYEYYADISLEHGNVLDARSITGIEAANMGVKVIDVHGNTHGRSIAEMHLPEAVMPLYQQLYKTYHSADFMGI